MKLKVATKNDVSVYKYSSTFIGITGQLAATFEFKTLFTQGLEVEFFYG